MRFFAESAHSKLPPRYILLPIILILTWFYFVTQHWVGSTVPPACEIDDFFQNLAGPWNEYLRAHDGAANALLIIYSALGDALILFLLIVAVIEDSSRAALPLLFFLILRQALQFLVSLPLAPGLIWHDPGFPSLFSLYHIRADFYFSAYVGIGVLWMIQNSRFGKKSLTLLGLVFILFLASTDIILRSHYTTDVYTSIITAISVSIFAPKVIPFLDRLLAKFGKYERPFFILVMIFGIGAFYATQHAIGLKPIPDCGIADALQLLTLSINKWINSSPLTGDVILVIMNTLLDALTLFVLGLSLWQRDIRPFLCIVFFMVLRQSLQLLISLPIPDHTIWHYPGIPSLLQTYNVTNDLYFSGHTGVSLIAALELARFKKRWLTILGYSIFAFEVIAVIIMQIHYTMDVYTAVMTVYCVTTLAAKCAPSINRFLTRFHVPRRQP